MSTPGRVYTPPAFARALWRAATELAPLGPWIVAEPAAGRGALLEPALADPRTEAAWAVELDPDNAEHLRRWTDPRLRVAHADALTLSWGAGAPPSELGRAHDAPAPDALANTPLLGEAWADLVIANPPYLRETGNAPTFRAIRDWNERAWRPWYRKDADLHHFFWVLGARWLKPGGVMALLTPAYAWESEAAAPARRFLAQRGAICGLWRAESERVFADAGVEAAVLLWRRGPTAPRAPRLAHRPPALQRTSADPVAIDPNGAPWRWQARDLPPLTGASVRVADLFRISEGISTGANRVRRTSTERVDAEAGQGIFLLRDHELRALDLRPATHARFVRRRRSARDATEWVLVVRDGDLPALDRGEPEPAHPALSAHLLRMRPILEARAEMRRNPRRSWYALAWAREVAPERALVTPKWARRPAFVRLGPDEVAMTDHRILVPRVPMDDALLERWRRAMCGDDASARFRALLKRKGNLLEFYGRSFEDVRLPARRLERAPNVFTFEPDD